MVVVGEVVDVVERIRATGIGHRDFRKCGDEHVARIGQYLFGKVITIARSNGKLFDGGFFQHFGLRIDILPRAVGQIFQSEGAFLSILFVGESRGKLSTHGFVDVGAQLKTCEVH